MQTPSFSFHNPLTLQTLSRLPAPHGRSLIIFPGKLMPDIFCYWILKGLINKFTRQFLHSVLQFKPIDNSRELVHWSFLIATQLVSRRQSSLNSAQQTFLATSQHTNNSCTLLPLCTGCSSLCAAEQRLRTSVHSYIKAWIPVSCWKLFNNCS